MDDILDYFLGLLDDPSIESQLDDLEDALDELFEDVVSFADCVAAEAEDLINDSDIEADVIAASEESEQDTPADENSTGYIQVKGEFPDCNFEAGDAPARNIGWAKAVMADGTPFVAELSNDGSDRVLSVMMPRLNTETKQQSSSAPSEETTEWTDTGVLHLGMLDLGQEPSLEVLLQYLKILSRNGIVTFDAETVNCAVQYCRDRQNMDVARVNIRLSDGGMPVASTSLKFGKFPQKRGGMRFTKCPVD